MEHETEKPNLKEGSLEEALFVVSMVTGKAAALVEAIRRCDNDPAYRDVWTFYATHGMKYEGPQYGKELIELEEALARMETLAKRNREAAEKELKEAGKL